MLEGFSPPCRVLQRLHDAVHGPPEVYLSNVPPPAHPLSRRFMAADGYVWAPSWLLLIRYLREGRWKGHALNARQRIGTTTRQGSTPGRVAVLKHQIWNERPSASQGPHDHNDISSIMAWHDGDARQQGQSALLGLPLCLCQAKCRLPQGLKPTDGHVCSAPAERTWGEGNQDQDHPMEGLSRAYAQHLGPVAPDKVDQRAVLIPKVCNDSLLQQSILAVANDLNLLRRRPARYSTCEHQVHQARRVRKGWHMPHAGPA